MRLFNSYVKHYNLFGCGKRYIEGYDNNIRGVIRNGRFRVSLTNSFGSPTTIVGRQVKILGFRILSGTAYGYVHAPEGLRYTGFGIPWGRNRLMLLLPTAWYKLLTVRLDTKGGE